MEKIVCGGNYTTNLIKDNINELIDESVLVKGDVTTLQSDVTTLETDSTSLRTDVDSLKENTTLYNGIKTLPQVEGTALNAKGFYADTSVGGGQFYYDLLKDKTEHNGGTVIAPEAIAAWDGTQGDLATLLDWSGTGSGCFVRIIHDCLLIEYFGASELDSADSIIATIKAASSLGCNVSTALKNTIMSKPAYFKDASVNDVDIDFSSLDISFTGVRTEGVEYDWKYGVFSFFGEQSSTFQDKTLTSELADGDSLWEVTDSSVFPFDGFIEIECAPSSTLYKDKIVWKMVKIVKIVSATEIRVNYLRGYSIPSGTVVRYRNVTPCKNINFKCKSISYDTPYTSTTSGRTSASSGVTFVHAFNCTLSDFEYKKNPKQAAHFDFTMSCNVNNISMYNPIEANSGGYNTQFERSLLFKVDNLLSDDDRHVFDATASSNGVISGSSSTFTQNSAFTTHGAYEHDLTYNNNVGHFQVAGSGVDFGQSAKRITLNNHTGNLLQAKEKVTDLTLNDCNFNSVVDINVDGLRVTGTTFTKDVVFYSKSSQSIRGNYIKGSSLFFGGNPAFASGVDVDIVFELCNFPEISPTTFQSTASLKFTNCALTNSGTGAVSTEVACKVLVLGGCDLSGVCLRYTAVTDQVLTIKDRTALKHGSRPETLSLLTIAKPSGSLDIAYDTIKSTTTTGRHVTAITAGSVLKFRFINSDFVGGDIRIDNLALTDGYLMMLGNTYDGTTKTVPPSAANYIYENEVTL